MTRIVITDCDHPTIEIERAIFTRAGYEVELAQCRTADQVATAGAGAVALLAQYAPITDEVLAALPLVRVVGTYGASLDNVELPAAARRGLRVVNVPDYGVDEVADHTLGLILALTRGIVGLDRAVHAGTWDFRGGGELRRSSSQQVGVIGLGRIGSAVARRALAFRFRVVAADPTRPAVEGVRLVELEELLATSDLVCVTTRFDPSTRHLLDAAAFARMKSGAYLVNTSRGGVVDQAALVDALRSGHLGGAALDVLEREPITPDDPLLSLPNVVLTPHAAFYSRESLVEMKRRAAEAITVALADLGPVGRS
ncbi:MAG TPA: C-terminal binding protein [Propionibacteriaceae bacterium]|jgi:D-3-phosphoglycerate dehydrogenase / 2-oxoglutarate reductase